MGMCTCTDLTGSIVPCGSGVTRRYTFADGPAAFLDVYPVTTPGVGGPTTVGSRPKTFQVRPAVAECDDAIPNSSLPGGIVAGCLDGSVRFVRSDIDPAVFWGSVTPAGGEVVALD